VAVLVGVGVAVFVATGVSVAVFDGLVVLVGDGKLAGLVATNAQAVMLNTLQITITVVKNPRNQVLLPMSPFLHA